jgi:gas vesicle structural protein
MDELSPGHRDIALVELLDRVIDKGVVISGDITISVADVDLIYLGLRVLLAPSDRIIRDTGQNRHRKGSEDIALRVRDRHGNDIAPE